MNYCQSKGLKWYFFNSNLDNTNNVCTYFKKVPFLINDGKKYAVKSLNSFPTRLKFFVLENELAPHLNPFFIKRTHVLNDLQAHIWLKIIDLLN